MKRLALCAALGALALSACAAATSTERVFDGRTVTGPYIEPAAYAAFAEAAYHEARGEWVLAEAAYKRALSADEDSPGIWTRLGVIACRADLQRALEAFDRATALRAYTPAWAEKSRCLQAHGQHELALQAAERAVALDPVLADSNLLIADIQRRLGHPDKARALLFSWLLMDRDALAHSAEIVRQAQLAAAPELEELVMRQLESSADAGSELHAALMARLIRANPRLARATVEAGILREDIDAARRAAHAAGLSTLAIAKLALSLGKPQFAAEQAELILAADPQNADAWVLATCSAALAGDRDRFLSLLHHDATGMASRAESAGCLRDLITWSVGEAAASHASGDRSRGAVNVASQPRK